MALLVGVAFLQAVSFSVGQAAATPQLAWPGQWQADSAFYDVWARPEVPVVLAAAPRSWLWGPVPFAVANEAYAESSTGTRLVEYLDKGRIEVNDPSADRASNYFVTSGLLVREMVSGMLQTGNATFEARDPAKIVVGGDANSPNAPTYAAFATLTGPSVKATGHLAQQHIARDGTVSTLAGSDVPTDPKVVGLTQYDAVTGHNIPAVFTDWARQAGLVLSGGRLVQGQVMDPLYVLGRPITEAYWADVLVNGAPQKVLVQLYERRALTYNPANPPQWQVEMANVGRAYYKWRYGSQAPAPAISAQITGSSLSVRGWNWPVGSSVSVEVDLPGNNAPLVEPAQARADAGEQFSLSLPSSPQLQGALQAGANVKIAATNQDATAYLPLSEHIITGIIHLQGAIGSVSGPPGGLSSLALTDRNGKQWPLALSQSTAVSYASGEPASLAVLDAGLFANLDATGTGSSLSATAVHLLSLSKAGLQFGYTLTSDGKSLQVVGTGWPGSRQVSFAAGPITAQGFLGDGALHFGAIKSDSRGNISGIVKLPNASDFPSGSLWLFAAAVGSTAAPTVAQPFDVSGQPPELAGPPHVTLLAQAGEQTGGVGSYCWQGACSNAIGTPLPVATLTITNGEVLGLRSQLGPNPQTGPEPLSFSAQLYPLAHDPTSLTSEGATVDGVFYLNPTAPPIFTNATSSGEPFSVALPPGLSPGRYALVLNISWPDASGKPVTTTYGFNLQVP